MSIGLLLLKAPQAFHALNLLFDNILTMDSFYDGDKNVQLSLKYIILSTPN